MMIVLRLPLWIVSSGILVPFGIGMLAGGTSYPMVAAVLIAGGALPKIFIEYLRHNTA